MCFLLSDKINGLKKPNAEITLNDLLTSLKGFKTYQVAKPYKIGAIFYQISRYKPLKAIPTKCYTMN